MGNRLVIHNNINGKRVNSLYYHWSADAISGVTELAKFLIAMYKVYNKADEQEAFIKQLNGKGKELAEKLDGSEKLLTKDKELLFNLISYHVSAGACYKESKNFAEEYFDETHLGSCNDGHIAFTKADMERFEQWSVRIMEVNWELNEKGCPILYKSTCDYSELLTEYFADDIEEACNEVNVEELYEFNEITPRGFTLDKITQELRNLKLAPVMWMDGEDTVVTL